MMNINTKKGFTLIELLTVIAIIGILAAILIPTVAKVRETARRSVDSSNLRQISQAGHVYALDNDNFFPRRYNDQLIASTWQYVVELAQHGGINDPRIWVSAADRSPNAQDFAEGNRIVESDGQLANVQAPAVNAQSGAFSFGVVTGINRSDPETTPVAFTRGLGTDGTWENDDMLSVYGSDGGHVAFLGGNVVWKVDADENTSRAFVDRSTGERTADLTDTVPGSRVLTTPNVGNWGDAGGRE